MLDGQFGLQLALAEELGMERGVGSLVGVGRLVELVRRELVVGGFGRTG